MTSQQNKLQLMLQVDTDIHMAPGGHSH